MPNTFSKTVAATATLVLPSRKGRKSLAILNRSGNNNVSLISHSGLAFGDGFRIGAGGSISFNFNQDGIETTESSFTMISESSNNVVDVIENF